MKILLLGDASSPHIIKWAKGLSCKDFNISIWSLTVPDESIYEKFENITIYSPSGKTDRNSYFVKFKYLLSLNHLKKTIDLLKPDIVHAHYASSYGLLGRLTKFHPFVISVWGSDVYDFPSNFLFRKILVNNFRKADKILSTSHVMARETEKYTSKNIEVTPFGVDLNVFKRTQDPNKDTIFIGTVKTLEEKYGLRYLIEAFAIFVNKYKDDNVKLLLVGGGRLDGELKKLASDKGIIESCIFTGLVPFSEVPYYHNLMDITVFPSILDSESFGVSAIEAGACEKPVIVSNVGGLPEVVEEGVTGIVVPPKDSIALADAIEMLYKDINMREKMGEAGRKRVDMLYNWDDNVDQMKAIYLDLYKSANN